MKSLRESILKNAEDTLNAGDDYFGLNSFPKKKDFKSHSVMKGSRCTWLCPAFKDIYEKELKAYLNKGIGQSWILPQYDEITGISVHIAKHSEGIFGIGVYLEGINRGTMTKIGVIIKDIDGERPTLAKAKEAGYEFLCQIRDDADFFKTVLKHITNTPYKWII
jgi:hypothetical protein